MHLNYFSQGYVLHWLPVFNGRFWSILCNPSIRYLELKLNPRTLTCLDDRIELEQMALEKHQVVIAILEAFFWLTYFGESKSVVHQVVKSTLELLVYGL